MIDRISHLSGGKKTSLAFTYDFTVILIGTVFSFYLRLGFLPPEKLSNIQFFFAVFILVSTQCLSNIILGIYKGIWRYSSIIDLLRLIRSVTIGSLIGFTTLFLFTRLYGIPRSVFIINWFVLVSFLGGGRFVYRLLRDFVGQKERKKKSKNVVIYGAGHGGEQLLREIKKAPHLHFHVLGFLDDDLSKKGKIIHGVKVLGNRKMIKHLKNELNVEDLFISIPSIDKKELSDILELSRHAGIKVKTLPRMSDILGGKVEVSHLRNVKIEDLLGREEVELRTPEIEQMVQGRTILITGAGGSIGSELVRQVVKFNSAMIICLDSSELNLYQLEEELRGKGRENFVCVLSDVRDNPRLEDVLSAYKPEVLFHCAAYKHVPIVESNPSEAIKTNIIGTRNTAVVANKYGVDKFVLISTDKAVNPTNVMGATKRIAEMVLLELQKTFETKIEIVRFGNVLGSSGSVVPLFRKQIEAGGPVTVTHPDINRFFMTIPEAAKLVLQAGAQGKGGEVFVLDMGKPIKIVDLAKEMIRLANLDVGEDIDIVYTGLRPGEKLFEELLADNESTLPTPHPKIKVACPSSAGDNFTSNLEVLLASSDQLNLNGIKNLIKNIVPEYTPSQDPSECKKTIH